MKKIHPKFLFLNSKRWYALLRYKVVVNGTVQMIPGASTSRSTVMVNSSQVMD
jgi:hypothetical protein